MTYLQRDFERARAALQGARRVLVVTGAGMSKESGIATFREAQAGLWAHFNPAELASPAGFEADPQRVWDWYEARRAQVRQAHPHAGHLALARYLKSRPQALLATQNVDGLHQVAAAMSAAGDSGAQVPVIELHGNILRTICHRCHKPISDDWLRQHPDQHPPRSPHVHGGLARPAVVWFGENLDQADFERVVCFAGACDLCLIIGTSGLVHPAAGLPRLAKQAGALLIEVNPEVSELSDAVDVFLTGGAADTLPPLLEH